MRLEEMRSPAELKQLSYEELETLAAEIRRQVVEVVAQRGGHLASNLGVVELTIALHRVFDIPEDKLIFDVGHQSYVHKLLTGRYWRFRTLRSFGGISGFPKRTESEYDVFADDTHRLLGNLHDGRDLSDVVVHNDDVGGFYSRVGSEASHRYADVGAHENGSVVESVSDESD